MTLPRCAFVTWAFYHGKAVDQLQMHLRGGMGVSRRFGESIFDEGVAGIQYDDSIVQDVATEKEQDMRDIGVGHHGGVGVPCQLVWRRREGGQGAGA